MTVQINANAKINLYLQVTGKRENGYHDLMTVMQSVSLHDDLTLERVEKQGVFLETDAALSHDSDNLICRAAYAYFARSKNPFGVRVKLEKRIPIAAGMGGGSADAAATLRALNILDHGRFSESELCEIAVEIGADVPFCVMGGTRLCRGIGEVMQPVENRLDCHLVIAFGGDAVSTPAAFAELDRLYDDFSHPEHTEPPKALLEAMQSGDLHAAAELFGNVFEEAIAQSHPNVVRWKQILLQQGALAAVMSGSGPAVWSVFEEQATAQKALEALQAAGASAFICQFA